MPGYWLVKTEPSTYSFDDLNREGVATWDGVKNPVAMKHLRAMQPGDEVLIYHTGKERSVVGVAQVFAAGGPPKFKGARRRARAGTLAHGKQEKAFADSAPLPPSPLSGIPVPPALSPTAAAAAA